MNIGVYEQTELPLQNRNEAYQSIQKELGARQSQVLAVIRLAGSTGISNAGIARQLFMGVNQITGRVFELREKGFVEIAGEEFDCLTNRKVTAWRVKANDSN